jgi:hypothetical protein
MLCLGAAVFLLTVTACGDTSNPTSAIADCLTAAGAKVTTQASDMEFVVDDGSNFPPDHVGLDKSRTLSVGSYHGSSNGGWKVYYAVRKGFQVSLGTLVGNPEKAAKVVAYIHPLDSEKTQAADACLPRARR